MDQIRTKRSPGPRGERVSARRSIWAAWATSNASVAFAAGVLAVLLGSTDARAEETSSRKPFGHKNQLTASVWRLYGASFDWHPSPTGQGPNTNTFTLSLLGTDAPQPYFVPRLGGDWFITDHISIGASGMFVFRSPKGSASSNLFVASPRVGYGAELTKVLAIWTTAGITYARDAHTDSTFLSSGNVTDKRVTDYGVALSLDAMLVVAPMGSFGFMVGPSADIAFAGNSDVFRGWRSVGLMGGLIGWFDPPSF